MNPIVQVLRDNWLSLLVLAVLASAFILLRSPATSLPSLEALDAELADGTPKLVEFYSDY
ncbi:MAG: hypothetical protein JW850_23475 [Thermoflexales bacterium]|nr:hypothetical protein [Thermoflexales bacterium]